MSNQYCLQNLRFAHPTDAPGLPAFAPVPPFTRSRATMGFEGNTGYSIG